MPTLTKKVFLSSTLIDLKDYRAAAIHACQRVGLLPIYMEDFPPDPRDAVAVCKAKVDEADVFVGVYAHRYGYVPAGSDISITEMEYDRAIERDIPVHLFVMSPEHPWPPSLVDKGRDHKRLERFKKKIGKLHTWKKFGDVASFQEDVLLPLHEIALKEAQAPATPPDNGLASKRTLPSPPEMHSVPPYILTNRFIGRRRELDELDTWAHSADPMLIVEAIGGMGKSALTWEWAEKRARKAKPDLVGILWWSFYEGGASTAAFVREALAYVTEQAPETLRSVPVGEQAQQLLAELRHRPFLLVLDGFERLLTAYHHPDPSKLKDDDVKSELRACTNSQTEDLLRQLTASAPSKVLVTTRLMPSALENKAHQLIEGVKHRELSGLNEEDGERLLRDLGVHGESGAIRRFLRKFDNHSLLISVLAGRIRDYRPAPSDFDKWTADPKEGGGLRLSRLKLEQRRTHILAYAFEGLEPLRKQLLSRIAVLSDAADFATIAAISPYLPPRPEEVSEPGDLESELRRDWDLRQFRSTLDESRGENQQAELEKISAREAELRERNELQKKAYQEYQGALQAYLDSPEYRTAPSALDSALKDLEERGLLQWDRDTNNYDLHPVVRGYAFDQLEEPDRVPTYERIRDHFEGLSPEETEEATDLSELKHTIQIYRALVGAGQLDLAAEFYWKNLSRPLLYTVAANSTVIELLTPLFPKGLDHLPNLVEASLKGLIQGDAAIALSQTGHAEAASQTDLLGMGLDIESCDWANSAIRLGNYSMNLRGLNRLAASAFSLDLSQELSLAAGDDDSVTKHFFDMMVYRIQEGRWTEAEAAYEEFSNRPTPRRRSYRVGDAENLLCWMKFLRGTLQPKDLEEALEVAIQAKNPFAQREIHGTRAELALQHGDSVNAALSAERALEMAAKSGALDLGARGCLARVFVLQGRHREARSLVADSDVLLIDAAEVYFQIDEPEKAKEYALRAYKDAWADGPPHIWWWGLERSKRLLAQLGVPEPQLPPFDPSKVEPIPFEAEIRAAIAKLNAEREERERQAREAQETEAKRRAKAKRQSRKKP